MKDIKELPIGVYVKINDKGEITQINSELFIKDTSEWIKIDEGFGDRFVHAQGNYFEKPLMNRDGSYNYKI